MSALDINQVLSDSVAATKTIVGKHWKNLEPFAEHEFRKFAESTEFLAQLKLKGQISDEELKARLEIQRLALKNVLLTIAGIGLITAQEIINAVLAIISDGILKSLSLVLPL